MSPVDNGLVVDGLEVRFGGLVAVNGLSLEAPIGRITGLIGPNGAGKSTSFDACFGFTRPSAGRVSFAGVDLTNAPVTTRAHLGIGRTFQRIELFDNLSVHHNVALGLEAKLAGRSPLTQLWARRSERQAVEEVTTEMLDLCHSPTSPTPGPAACRPASGAWSSWPGPWPAATSCCCSTSRPRASTPTRAATSASSCAGWSRPGAPGSWSSSTT